MTELLKLGGWYKVIIVYNLHISDFPYWWPEVRSISWPPHYKSMGEKSNHLFTHWIRLFYYEMSCIRLLFMIQVQILVGDLHNGHLGSDDVIRGHQRGLSLIIHELKELQTREWCSPCQDASPHMQHDLLGSTITCNLTWPWPEVKFWHDLSRSPGTCFDAAWREEHDVAWIRTLACLVQKLFSKILFPQKGFFGVFWTLAAKPLRLAQIWLNLNERTAQELTNAFFIWFLPRIVSEIL